MELNNDLGAFKRRVQDACRKNPPDLAGIERLIAACGDLNLLRDDLGETLLSDLLLWYPEIEQDNISCKIARETAAAGDGKADRPSLPQIAALFLKHGFCVEGRAGRECLGNLTYRVQDAAVIETEKLLLDAGADPMIESDGETVVEQYRGEESFRVCEGEPEAGVFYHTMAEIAQAAAEHRNYRGIELWETGIGRRIDRIEMACSGIAHSQRIYGLGTWLPKGKCYFMSPIVFHCGDKELCVTQYGDIRVDPTVRERAGAVYDVESFFGGCMGQRIMGIDFTDRSMKKDGVNFRLPVIRLRLENGTGIHFSTGMGKAEAYFRII